MRFNFDATSEVHDAGGVMSIPSFLDGDIDLTAEDFWYSGYGKIYAGWGRKDYSQTSTVNGYEMVKSTGSVFTIDIPEEAWQTDDESGLKYFVIYGTVNSPNSPFNGKDAVIKLYENGDGNYQYGEESFSQIARDVRDNWPDNPTRNDIVQIWGINPSVVNSFVNE